ncbi:hypothetical protein HanHA300_Chr05g0188121 [Helianthus annuus]|nr:hypothetical protein HanHA300_Chr05g0188121 [Helianthus annuus]
MILLVSYSSLTNGTALLMILNIHADPMCLSRTKSIPLNLSGLLIWNLTSLILDYHMETKIMLEPTVRTYVKLWTGLKFGDKRELLHRDIDDLLVIIMPILSISVFEVGPKSRTC